MLAQAHGNRLASDRVLTVRQAGLLCELIRGVDRRLKIRIYPAGADDAEHPLVVVMRAFTHKGGGFLNETDDIRDGYVWCSGFTESWHEVSWLIRALSNLDGHLGFSGPMATIDEETT